MTVSYRYRAATAGGQFIEGTVQATSRRKVLEDLTRRQLYPVAVDLVLQRLSQHLEEVTELRSQIRSALLYPALMAGVASVGVTVLLLFVIPRFAAILADTGGALPLSMRLLVAASAVLTHGWWVLLLLAGGIAYWVRGALERPATRGRWHAARLRWPWVGDLELKYVTAQFARTLGLLLASGV